MKRYGLLLALLVATFSLKAQDNESKGQEEIRTLFGQGEKMRIGWFVGIDPGYTQFDGKDVWMGGICGGVVINHNFSVGLLGRGWVNRNGMFYPNVKDSAGAYLEGGYGGLLLEYTLFPKSPVHVTFPLIIGGGGVSYVVEQEIYDPYGHDYDTDCHSIDNDAFFVVEPGVRAEVNVFRFMRMSAGVSYRYVAGLDLINTPSGLMNNFTATVGLKFGKF